MSRKEASKKRAAKGVLRARSAPQLALGLSDPPAPTSKDPVRGAPSLCETVARSCEIVPVGKRRDGGTRFWCLAHRADATAKYGRRASHCRYAHQPPLKPDDILEIDTRTYGGGIALWGAVPPIYDTTRLPLERGIHVHARTVAGGEKVIDSTFRGVVLRDGPESERREFTVSELDAIYYMTTTVFGYDVRYVECSHCQHPHLDKDWFSVHEHRRHLCAGCGKTFRDTVEGIGNPVAGIRAAIGHRTRTKPSKKVLKIRQKDFPGGIQIWGSNPAIVWTSPNYEEAGIHVHAFADGARCAFPDDTYAEVVIDDIKLDDRQVRTLMAQSALPHLAGRVHEVRCSRCHAAKFSIGENAFTPAQTHQCDQCSRAFSSTGRLRNVIGNPLIGVIAQLRAYATRPPQSHSLGLLPETL